MSRPRAQRTRIYFGCEGQSEQSYGKRLNEITDEAGLHLHFDNDVLQPGGGSPLALVELAVRRIQHKKKIRGDFAHRAILLDRDTLHGKLDWETQIDRLAAQNGLTILWENCCHEAFLLRHLDGHAAVQPPTAALALQSLHRVWPEYYKGMPAVQLAARIDLQAVRRAALEEAGLAAFLRQIGLLPNPPRHAK